MNGVTNQITSAALDKIAKRIEQPCPECGAATLTYGVKYGIVCGICSGSKVIHPYASMNDWLAAHGEEQLYHRDGTVEDKFGVAQPDYDVVVTPLQALDLLEEAGMPWEKRMVGGYVGCHPTKRGLAIRANTAEELVAKILAKVADADADPALF